MWKSAILFAVTANVIYIVSAKAGVSCKGDPNAQPGCGVNCGRLCSNYKSKDVSCIQVCYEDGCDCKKNYVLDTNTGKCVLPSQCTPTCKANEVFSNCTQAICRAQNCSQKGQPIACALIAEGHCKKGCVCAEKYLRDSKGNCIPEDQCDTTAVSCNGDPNAKPGCGVNCGRLCSNYKSDNVACAQICNVDGCDCKENYVLDTNTGKCVLPDQCTAVPEESCGGDPNAKPGCGVNCGRLCSNYKNASQIVCPAICKVDGCDCKEGYVLDKTGKCVLPDQCDENQCNKPNEEYQQCPGCSPGTCEAIGKTYKCPLQPADSSKCTGGCRCKSGYYYNKIGDCITKEQCLQCNGTNEYFSCGSACDNVCATLDKQNKTNCPIINIQCNKQCYCEDGYARDNNNICVPIDQCPGKETEESCGGDPNAKPGCGSNCRTTCSNYKSADRMLCAAVCRSNGCDCKEGYVLNDKTGKCVLPDQCPAEPEESCGGDPNAKPGCGVNCGRLCSNYKNASQVACPAICKVDGCDCKEGYVLDDKTGKCVLPDQCTTEPEESCGGDPNAKPGCGSNCGRTCSTYKIADRILCAAVCKENGCDCKEGYVLDDKTGKCVLPDQCPTETEESCGCGDDPNAKPGCGSNCGRTCSTYKIADRILCAAVCKENGCDCREGYVLDENLGKCVLPDQCPTETEESCGCGGDPNAKPGCGVNCGRTCSTYKIADRIRCAAVCKENGCDCKEGYVLDDNTGKCVLPDQCSIDENQCNKPNEEYQQCPDCSPGTCESIGKTYNCPLQPADSSKCTGGCRCKSGYYYNKIGECVTKEQCQQCNGPNEYFSCGPECDNVCATLDKQNKTNCPFINKQCNKKCYCEDGYARDNNNICVPIDQCTGGCKENERYVECPEAECVPLTCADAGFPVACPRIANGRCPSKPACICNSGYLRNSEGICVPQNECSSCRGDPNARPGCGVNCGRLCSNYQNSDGVSCPEICDLNGCDCIDGYVLDTNTGKCVLPEQCTSPCGPNQVYSDCVNGGCDKRNCSQINDKKICIDPVKCEGGCICQDGYLRDEDGTCVPEDQCKEKCPEGETFSNCPPVYRKNCNSELCPLSRDDPAVCATTRQCGEPRCVCSYLRKRNRKTGKCVLASECPPFPCKGKNEVYDSCPPSCPGQNCSDYLNNSTCPKTRIGIVVPCKPACRCKENTYRNSKGVCVSGDKCKCESS